MDQEMNLGTFSVSLAVKDLGRSRKFYEKLGFEKVGGDGESYVIMSNAGATLGLFQGMFEGNILTFNPSWSGPHQEADDFTDVRTLEARVRKEGLAIASSNTAESESGPAHFTMIDPDGNAILIDQHR